MSEAQQENVADFKIMGMGCTFAGPLSAVISYPKPLRMRELLRSKGAPQWEVDAWVPACPHCKCPVGKFPLADYDEILTAIATTHRQSPASLREMISWAETQPRCLPLDPKVLGRAYAAHLKRSARNAKRAGRVQ